MKYRSLLTMACGLLFALSLSPSSARAQSAGSGSLGGYGGSMTMGSSRSGSFIPYAGNYGGFMPYRMGGSSSLAFQSRGNSPMGSTRTSFSLSPMTGGMSLSSQMNAGAGTRIGTTMQSTSVRMGVMPLNFGYPFRQPPSLTFPSAPGTGMGM
jgi:hypothetical protein